MVTGSDWAMSTFFDVTKFARILGWFSFFATVRNSLISVEKAAQIDHLVSTYIAIVDTLVL